MQINETKKFDVILHFSKALTFLAALTIVVLALHSPTLAWLMGGERTVQVSAAPAATVPPAAPAVDVPAVDPDTTAEGQDVLMVDATTTPDDLWEGLLDTGFRGIPNDGPNGTEVERLHIPVGTTVTVPSGRYVATFDGFAQYDADEYGCWFDPEAPAWESSTGDGLCHVGPHAHELTGDLV